MAKKPTVTVGDAAIVHGRMLTVTALEKRDNGVVLAVLEDVPGLKAREVAYAEAVRLRDEMNELDQTVKRVWDAWSVVLGGKPVPGDDVAPPEYLAALARRDTHRPALLAAFKEQEQKAVEAMFRLKLRSDLLAYWVEKQAWVSDGRILSDAQHRAFLRATGSKATKVKPEAERFAFTSLAATGA